MSDKIRIRYNFRGIEAWEVYQQQLRELIQQDTGEEYWIETKSLPPIGIPPPVTKECLEKIKKLEGVVVNEINDD
ncbi:hypothetical protein BKA59DRAFT_541089 [Fusarium tricinctum]|uniref:Uncharacterized protein n=1 Tax=Fusarium tricinctum TaxID=61284 RepID=A0A8K0S728_9HYPO|nr:hypothetical protein BKA59DRAFT_541089 [Fusarium tricinctum]